MRIGRRLRRVAGVRVGPAENRRRNRLPVACGVLLIRVIVSTVLVVIGAIG